MFVLSFKNGNDDPTSDSFDEHFMPLIEIKDFNLSINNKPFFDQPVKKNKKHKKNLSKCHETISSKTLWAHINLSRQTNTSIPQKLTLQENWKNYIV